MKVGLYDPYLDTLGGGEKYILTIASILSKEHEVSLFWDDQELLSQASERFHVDLSKVTTVQNIFLKKKSLFSKFQETHDFDLLIYMSDGSIPFLFAKKNFLLFQFPTPWVNGKSVLNKLKLRKIDGILCYSTFVKKHLQKTFAKKITVLAPPIDLPEKYHGKKENYILTVGRFTKGMNTKKQKELIELFKKLCDGGLKNWKFILAGGVLPSDEDFVAVLKQLAKGYPIEVYENISHEKLLHLYQAAKIYWHAAGFGEDLSFHPERAEHFGITTVEAMSCGAVPIVFHGGGQVEIVAEGAGYTWTTINEIFEKTKKLIEDKKLWDTMSQKAQERARAFDMDVFTKNVKELFV